LFWHSDISDVTIIEIEIEIAILAQNRTESKSQFRTAPKRFNFCRLVHGKLWHRCSAMVAAADTKFFIWCLSSDGDGCSAAVGEGEGGSSFTPAAIL